MIRILLVDDHPVVRAGYQRLLEQSGQATVVAQAASVDEAWIAWRAHAPDLTITDLSLPGSGGLELLRRLREAQPDARVIVFSMHDSETLVGRALDLGACGYVTKSSPPEDLLEAVQQALRGQRYLSPGLAPAVAVGPGPASLLESLTPREFEIFQLIARGESPQRCAQALHLSPKTVANHQSVIKDKLGVSTLAGWAHLALRCGLLGGEGAQP